MKMISCDVCGKQSPIDEEPDFIYLELPGELLDVPGERGTFDICGLKCLTDVARQLTSSQEEDESPRKGRLVATDHIPQTEDVDLPPPMPMPEVRVR